MGNASTARIRGLSIVMIGSTIALAFTDATSFVKLRQPEFVPQRNPMAEKHRRRAALTGSRARRTKPRSSRFKVASVGDLQPGESMKFLLPIRGADEECFVINFKGELHAYVNRCRH